MNVSILIDDYTPTLDANRLLWKRWKKRGVLIYISILTKPNPH